jgi:hypothetical protein
LYDVEGAEGFSMDIEYKVTSEDQLVIKQARPWVSFWADVKANNDLGITEFLNPQSSSSLGNNELVTVRIANTGLNDMNDFDISLFVDDQLVETITITETIEPFSDADFQFTVPQDFSAIGDYNLTGVVSHINDEYVNNDTLNYVLSKVHVLDGALSIGELAVVCNDEIELGAVITNLGETTITNVQIQVVVNGFVLDVINAAVDVPFAEEGTVPITIDDNLMQTNNNVTLNLISVNSQIDGDGTNNSASTTTTLDSDYDIVTLIINADNYPGETSWEVIDEGTNETIAVGGVWGAGETFSQDICLNYGSCFTLYVFDSFGDGICCGFGEGDFLVLDSSGATLLSNDGDFGSEAQEVFCPDGTGCGITADISLSHVTDNNGAITINTNSGVNPFLYSIDGGLTFVENNNFTDLAPGEYTVMIQGAAGVCSYEEIVSIETCMFTTADIEDSETSSVVTANGSIVITPTSGVGPYQYSIDGGQNFVANNEFLDLAVGNYNVIVQDASEICQYEVSVPILVGTDLQVNEYDLLANAIKVYPNPTYNSINVEFELFSEISDDVKIEVYDNLGRTIKTSSLSKNSSGKTTLSLDGFVSGSYFIRCHNGNFSKTFKVVKM